MEITGLTGQKRYDRISHYLPDSEHGGNVYRISEETGIPVGKLLDFSASINPLGISGRVKEVINGELDNLVNYPDPDTKALKHKIAQYHGIDAESVICGNGSTELIYLLPRVLRPKKVLVTAPTFSEYERACGLSQESRVMSYESGKDKKFRINADDFISVMQGRRNSELKTPYSSLKSDMAFLCNPNNPTGGLLSREDVLRIADAARDAGCVLVVDEAFIDFCPDHSVIKDVQDNPFLIVLRSMTKFFALTGLRIGYGVFHKDIIGKIKRLKEPWSVNNLAQRAAVTALEDRAYINETFRIMKKEKEYMEKNFQAIGMEYFPSAANFYLLRLESAGKVIVGLKKKGVLIRDCSNFKGLDHAYVRVAVKSHDDNVVLLNELQRLLAVT